MNKVEEYSNWCYVDQLDGETLEDGEKIICLFPDGKKSEYQVKVDNSSYMISDHGSPWEVHVSKAYIGIEYNGVPARIRLYDSGILCERLNEKPDKKLSAKVKRTK